MIIYNTNKSGDSSPVYDRLVQYSITLYNMDKSNICSYLIAEMEHKVSKHLMIEVKEMMNKSFLAGQVHAMRQE